MAPKFKVNDLVRIVVPKFVLRVGYPKEIKDYIPEAEAALGEHVRKLMGLRKRPDSRERFSWNYDRIMREAAYVLAKTDGFGGRERSIHWIEKPEMAGRVMCIEEIYTRNTGTYFPPWSGCSYYGEYDYEPGGLSDMKSHRIAKITPHQYIWSDRDALHIPLYHVEKVEQTATE